MKKVELLSPAGNFEALVAAVQNGADAVYFGANKFNARANSTNFNEEELEKAIVYAKLRNVKTHLTLNILIKNEEFDEAMALVEFAYKSGIDAIIVQDLGLANEIIKTFPDLEVHSSTQMTIYDIDGVKEVERIGFSRAVLARELSVLEIKEICEKSKIDIEVFIHGALCISYSGQCLMSSIIGGRSGNRGKCAGTCRLPYELIDKTQNKTLEKGYLLSSKDVCTLDILPELINAGVKSFKIEGRMKSPEYVGIVTAIYRKYIDLAESNQKYIVDEEDRKKLMQIFNRGGFSTGYLKGKLGKNMMYTKKPNHIGIYVGDVISYNKNKGYVKFKAKDNIELGDSISINDESCKISELMENKQNIKIAEVNKIITIGRIKGKIKIGDKIYKTVSNSLIKEVQRINSKENIKRKVNCNLKINKNEKMRIELHDVVSNTTVELKGKEISIFGTEESRDSSVPKIEKDKIEVRIKEQIRKTGNTVFEINNIEIEKDNNIFIPIKEINELRRNALDLLENKIKECIKRNESKIKKVQKEKEQQTIIEENIKNINVSVLLNSINESFNYFELKNVDKIYIPVSEFIKSNFSKDILKAKLQKIIKNYDVYVYLPVILKDKFKETVKNNINEIVNMGIKGFVVSNISQLEFIKDFECEMIANYTFNIFNNQTIEELEKYKFNMYTVSPEMEAFNIQDLKSQKMRKEAIVYGRTVLMNSEYCPIGEFKNCKGNCKEKSFILKDRKGFEFPVITDRINCNSKIYNSKITSIKWKDLNIDSIRIDVLDESIDEINKIIKIHKNNEKIEGKEYTNGNLNTKI